ncbi:MAG: hypothetical protein RMY62_029880 [Nostoc sp. ZfuVER08]|uniref:Uncharacterized protein n=1 Tax=Nostoc punctiforme FACHB-252 TaxID=1357509 RepID=A0ABR8H6N8_NOSPU|nr:hypothetical protein [Nostoc punctiforme]MBD2610895.1 hypothetical protein [Nostoc punctiforme FACHB-252]MBL1200777.1 hypothetical protein [Nostoc sp. GBBB01]MDZ8014523.1 hypothetical protein [Nostoc sp. ZfuVER08]
MGFWIEDSKSQITELSDRNYILALKAYQERIPVYFTGDLIKSNGIFILKNPHKFHLDDTE